MRLRERLVLAGRLFSVFDSDEEALFENRSIVELEYRLAAIACTTTSGSRGVCKG